MDSLLPYTGKEFLESLNDGREVWIYGKRVNNIAEHPAFRNTVRMIARLYDALHRDHAEKKNLLTCPTEWGGFTHRYFVAPRSAEELVAGRDAIAAWARLTYGWLGRSPDYKAAFLATLGANAEFYAPYQDNARRWYRTARSGCRLSTTRWSSPRSTEISRRGRRAVPKMSMPTSPKRPIPGSA